MIYNALQYPKYLLTPPGFLKRKAIYMQIENVSVIASIILCLLPLADNKNIPLFFLVCVIVQIDPNL